ncbi:transglycosylase SLT domain-containing protein [Pelagibacterium halotolerans]|uniref:transglycosylase SLT domain-containing protein n=1 Tax=Pelagibacterium halotolerans TaxID=531813 RepID=UPI003850BEED
MPARRLIALFAALVVAVCATGAKAQTREQVDVLIQYYAQYYGVPHELVRRVVNRESTFNPAARNGPYYGLMQILPATARTMGYTGPPEGLLDAETNLIYAVKYLRGAYLVAQGDQDRAVQLYAAGYYYHARDMGLLEETGLRPGPKSPVAPTPPTQVAAAPASVEPPAPVSVPLAYAPPPRPSGF